MPSDTAASAAAKTASPFQQSANPDTIPLELVRGEGFELWRDEQSDAAKAWLARLDFAGKPGTFAWLPDESGAPARLVAGGSGDDDLAELGNLPLRLPEGSYELSTPAGAMSYIGWGLGAYQFTRYRPAKRAPAALVLPQDVGRAAYIEHVVAACALTRDLINCGAEDMLPSALAEAARTLAETFGATCRVTVGAELLDAGYRTIHAVGRAAANEPRLIDLTWGEPDAPKVTLVGKGVCFDSGGLNLKPAAGMRTMKKDMGGAATVLGLARLIMAEALPVRLRVLVPAVENAVSGNALRPGDVIETYAGDTVEIDNTDAEGRLVLADALALACEEAPELLIDWATLTGAARVAVGTEIAAMFATSDAIARAIAATGERADDPVWRLPLHKPYRHLLRSDVADTVNSASGGFAGAITAALFLQRFVSEADWVHFDVMAFNTRARPGRPKGGEAMGLRAVYDYLAERYGS